MGQEASTDQADEPAKMSPGGHIGVASAVGVGVAIVTQSPWAIATAVGAGVLVDADHSIDYYRWFVMRNRKRVFYLLHAWEYLALLVMASAISDWNPLLLGATAGYLSHLVADQWANKAYAFTYSIIYRAAHGFRMQKISPWTVEGNVDDLVGLMKGLHFSDKISVRIARFLSKKLRI
jgi:hypothetical protein